MGFAELCPKCLVYGLLLLWVCFGLCCFVCFYKAMPADVKSTTALYAFFLSCKILVLLRNNLHCYEMSLQHADVFVRGNTQYWFWCRMERVEYQFTNSQYDRCNWLKNRIHLVTLIHCQ